ncbi:GTP-binding protein [Clavibacter zhangzhiyongii]|uniref:GTP-binding protein n=1 Tax=Clavibacter zhangzhiyongii TaxID=2768071 RepID=UPI0039E01DD4
MVAVASVAEIRDVLLEPRRRRPARRVRRRRAAGRAPRVRERRGARRVGSGLVVAGRPPRHVVALLALLAPAARVVPVGDRASLASAPLRIGRQRARRLAAGMGWQQALAGVMPAASVSSLASSEGLGVHVFRDPRPFHPARLHAAVARDLVPGPVGRIVRSRGLARLASRPATVGSWATAGDVLRLDPTGMASWDPESPAGQEIAFVGERLDGSLLDEILGACLLEPGELVAGPDAWHGYADPFPAWDTEHRH